MEESILNTVKKIVGVDTAYEVFDLDLITHINSVFAILHQLGIGPAEGFFIEDDFAIWSDFFVVDEPRYNQVKTYIYLKVRLLFDPPSTSFAIEAMNRQIQELEWRITAMRDEIMTEEV